MVIKTRNEKELFDKAAEVFVEEYKNSLAEKGRFSVALSGGTTPKELFKRLINMEINWKNVDIFMVDERYLPPNHLDSNYRLLWDDFFSKINIPIENLRTIKYMESLEISRLEYEKEVKDFIKDKKNSFDLIVLGMGKDGHTASLFSDNLEMSGDVVPSLEGREHNYNRISLGLGVINRCRKKMFILKNDKKEILKLVLSGGKYPASFVVNNVMYIINEEDK
ncbi:6-phosphogluconolactonase [uncultured Ilyobacter sp.]|uniref:6-phosphogluconolactonase n=1 Tax=uncultured Ilyobacter sp. TaxID=544433 RepID=UPI0029C0CFC4|nr:6-phosphogluconolactonase [uncultured Ilyobacter sp.]